MTHLVSWAKWGFAVAAIMASPIVLVLAVPAILGLAMDVADVASARGVVLILSGAVGLMLLRRMARRLPAGREPHRLAEAA